MSSDDYREKDGKIYKEGALGNTEEYEIKGGPIGEYIDTPEGIKDVAREISGKTEIIHGYRHCDNEKDVSTVTPDYSFPHAQSSRDSTEQIHPSNDLRSKSRSPIGYSSDSDYSSSYTTYTSNARNYPKSSFEPKSQSNGIGCGLVIAICCGAILFILFSLYPQKPAFTPHKNVNIPSRQTKSSYDFSKDSSVKYRLPTLPENQTEQSAPPVAPQSTTTPDSYKPLSGILCILPNGSEIRVSGIECRNKNGVIYE